MLPPNTTQKISRNKKKSWLIQSIGAYFQKIIRERKTIPMFLRFPTGLGLFESPMIFRTSRDRWDDGTGHLPKDPPMLAAGSFLQDVKMDDVRAEAAVAVASATSYGWMVLVLGCANLIGRAQ